jgi:hypothetical protein
MYKYKLPGNNDNGTYWSYISIIVKGKQDFNNLYKWGANHGE